jgi:hypothetical protein
MKTGGLLAAISSSMRHLLSATFPKSFIAIYPTSKNANRDIIGCKEVFLRKQIFFINKISNSHILLLSRCLNFGGIVCLITGLNNYLFII